MLGTVQEFGTSQKGAQKLKIDGKWYYAGRCDISQIQNGDKVEFESSVFGKTQRGQDLYGLQKIQKAAQTNGSSVRVPESATVDEASLRFISNVVGSALTAGTIKLPEDLAKWTIAAHRALQALEEDDEGYEALATGTSTKEEFDDDIPF